jgi:Family of unknown function (DUF6653)
MLLRFELAPYMQADGPETKRGVADLTSRRWDIFKASERFMAMDEAAWARHANPLSVYSRFSILPLMSLAIWSRVSIGWWAVAGVALVVLWTWWNPRAFGPPASTRGWASRGTFGERVFLNRKSLPVPHHHVVWAKLLTGVSVVGIVPWIYGLWALDLSAVLLGLALIIGGKTWFVDRMVWLYQDMKDQDPTYASWLR